MEDKAISLNAVLKALKIYENEEFYSVLKRVFTDLPSVTSQRPTGHWIFYGRLLKCSNCGYINDDILDECPNCKISMIEPQQISDRNLKMWEDIYAEEKRRKRNDKK